MAKVADKSKSKGSSAKPSINELIQNKIAHLAEQQGISPSLLEEFALFVIKNHDKQAKPSKPVKSKPLNQSQLKAAIFKHFNVKDVTSLKKSSMFQMATSGLGRLDLRKKLGWETLYRKFVGILPGEENETGYGCVNGINIFNYDMPWRAFGLDPKTASADAVKSAYRELSKVYHPDNRETGDAQVFDRLTIFYKSLTEGF